MADMDKFSERLVELAERFADVTDAAQGRGHRRGGKLSARWLILPAMGAGAYALGASGALTRQAKSVVNQAKDRASELPDDLLSLVHDATGKSNVGRSNGRSASSSSSQSRSSSGRTANQRRRKRSTSSAR
jgi:hypothetical protein